LYAADAAEIGGSTDTDSIWEGVWYLYTRGVNGVGVQVEGAVVSCRVWPSETEVGGSTDTDSSWGGVWYLHVEYAEEKVKIRYSIPIQPVP